MARKITYNIAVMDYCCNCIKMYTHDFKKGVQLEDVKKWLEDNTDFKDDQCYFMFSEEEIEIVYPDVEEQLWLVVLYVI